VKTGDGKKGRAAVAGPASAGIGVSPPRLPRRLVPPTRHAIAWRRRKRSGGGGSHAKSGLPDVASAKAGPLRPHSPQSPLSSPTVSLSPCSTFCILPFAFVAQPVKPGQSWSNHSFNLDHRHYSITPIPYPFTVLYDPCTATMAVSVRFEPFRGNSTQVPYHEQFALKTELFLNQGQSSPIVSNRAKSRCFF